MTPAFTTDQSDRNRSVSPALALFQLEQGTNRSNCTSELSNINRFGRILLRWPAQLSSKTWNGRFYGKYIKNLTTGLPSKRHLVSIWHPSRSWWNQVECRCTCVAASYISQQSPNCQYTDFCINELLPFFLSHLCFEEASPPISPLFSSNPALENGASVPGCFHIKAQEP